jgi:N-acetylglucosamine kinase-like BadF-type ATPase
VTPPNAAVIAVDGGNSKTDLLLVDGTGRVIGRARGPTISHQQVGIPEALRRLRALLAEAGTPGGSAAIAVFCVAGADLPSDVRLLRAAFTEAAVARRIDVRNDTFAALRAGTSRPWGIAVISGAGVNCAGIGPDGRTYTMPALGDISGDWGGGGDVGMAALAAAVRGRDGRGPRTVLERLVPAQFGVRQPLAVVRGLYAGRFARDELRRLAPVAFDAARGGDEAARAIISRLADELATMATAMARRMHVARSDVEIVLAGGLVGTDDATFHARFSTTLHRALPRSVVRVLRAPPVLGAGLIGLDLIGAPDAAKDRLVAELS